MLNFAKVGEAAAPSMPPVPASLFVWPALLVGTYTYIYGDPRHIIQQVRPPFSCLTKWYRHDTWRRITARHWPILGTNANCRPSWHFCRRRCRGYGADGTSDCRQWHLWLPPTTVTGWLERHNGSPARHGKLRLLHRSSSQRPTCAVQGPGISSALNIGTMVSV